VAATTVPISASDGDVVELVGHISRPPGIARVPGLVLCHGFPSGPRGAATAGLTYPDLADRLARESGWCILTFNFRGTGGSPGDFSVDGWLADVAAAVRQLDDGEDVDGVWLAGVDTGGTLAICHAARDPRVRGVAVLAAPASLRSWVRDPDAFLAHARAIGVVKTKGFPPDPVAWAAAVGALDPLAAAARLAPRPLLVIHGSDDDVVPTVDARAFVGAAGPSAELRIVQAAGHRLRHDPRAVATLIGWLARQAP
jgi:pimeloyl-ACP methyl ester carboxylesterase